MFEILVIYKALFWSGFLVTLKLFTLIILLGIVGGTILGALSSRSDFFGKIVVTLKFLSKVIPVLVILFWFHYPLQVMLGIVVDPFWTAVVVFGSINVITVAYLLYTEIKLLPRKYIESAKVLGMDSKDIVKYIKIPLVYKRSFPEIMLIQATMLEYTLFASLISVPEIFRVSQNINSMIYDPVSIYSLLIVFFIIILTPLHLTVMYFKKHNKIEYV